jgi:hypothetical protein
MLYTLNLPLCLPAAQIRCENGNNIKLRNISSILKDAVLNQNIDGKDLIEQAIKLGGDEPL